MYFYMSASDRNVFQSLLKVVITGWSYVFWWHIAWEAIPKNISMNEEIVVSITGPYLLNDMRNDITIYKVVSYYVT